MATKRSGATGYWEQTRDFANSLVLTAPLFVFYQVGILFTSGWMNGADFFSHRLIGMLGGNVGVYTMINLAILATFGFLYIRLRSERALTRDTALWLVVESTVYAILLGVLVVQGLLALGFSPPLSASVVAAAGGAPHEMGVFDAIVLSVGAGTYEELVFRVFLLGGLLWLLLRWGARPWVAGLSALILSSLVFSAAHYVPFGMDPWELWSFAFRFAMGIAFGLLYWLRGFAVAVYTHTIYDILILVPRALVGG